MSTVTTCKVGHRHLATTPCPWCARIESELQETIFLPTRTHDDDPSGKVAISPDAFKPIVLAEGTDDEATVPEYVGALALKIIKHACIRQQMKVKLPNNAHKQMTVEVLVPEALNHVLTVIFSGGEVNDTTLKWQPSQIVTKKSKIIMPGA